MVDVVVGALIVVVASSSLLLSIEVAESAFRSVGRESLSPEEKSLLTGIKASLPYANDEKEVVRKFRDMAEQIEEHLPLSSS